LVIGTEECERSIAQSAINTSKKFWENYLISLLGPSYTPLRSHTLQAIHMICFVHESIAHLVSDISSSAVATGLQNTLGNKGGVSIYLKVLNTSFIFTNAHLAAGQKSVSRRNNNFHLINSSTPKKLFSKSRASRNSLNGDAKADKKVPSSDSRSRGFSLSSSKEIAERDDNGDLLSLPSTIDECAGKLDSFSPSVSHIA
jgi:hypothetical protein